MTSKTTTLKLSRSLIIGIAGLFVLLAILLTRPGGIGGTGIGDGEGNGGIGGTGISTRIGTGFVGRIDRFGSIWVNGAEIFYDSDIPVSFNQRIGVSSDLKIGHVVQVIARADAQGVLHATRLDVRYEVVGRVQSLNQNTATVFNETVVLPTDNTKPLFGNLALGDIVAVSGFRRGDGVIVASRIERTAENQPSQNPAPLQPFAQPVEYLSLSGYAKISADGYTLYGYKLGAMPESFSPDQITTLTAEIIADKLENISVRQTPKQTRINPSVPQPKAPPVEVPAPKPQQKAVPAPKKQTPKKLNKASPIKPQPIREDRPEIIKPVTPERLEMPTRPVDEPQDVPQDKLQENLTDPQPQQRAVDDGDEQDIRREEEQEAATVDEPIEAPVDQQADPEIPEQRDEIDVPERDTITPERDTRAEPPTRPARTDRPDHPDRTDRPERPDRPDRPERPDRPDRPR